MQSGIAMKLFSLCRYGFYISILLFVYGTLFPFHFDFTTQSLTNAWSHARTIPFWDAERGRIHSLPDMLANLLLTFPLGFFGFLRSDRKRQLQSVLLELDPGLVTCYGCGITRMNAEIIYQK